MVDRPLLWFPVAGPQSEWVVEVDPLPKGAPAGVVASFRAYRSEFGSVLSADDRLEVFANLKVGASGGLLVSDLTVRVVGADAHDGVTSTRLREVPVNSLLRKAVTQFARMSVRGAAPDRPSEPLAAPPWKAGELGPALRRARWEVGAAAARLTDASRTRPDIYLRTALQYLELQEQVGPRGQILEAIADRLDCNPETIRTRLRVATERGYLTGRRRGRIGASPGPALLALTDRGDES